MATTNTPEASLDYLLKVLRHTNSLEPNYHAVANDASMVNANVAQKRFKAIIEKSGQYKLVKGKVVDANAADNASGDNDDAPVPATPTKATPKKRKSVDEKGSATPKRGRKPKKSAGAAEEGEINEAGNDVKD